MFRRPAVYHPYKPSAPLSPAGFRLGDYVPKRCFNLFHRPDFNFCSPDFSPLFSPIRGARHPEDDAPPTIRLGDLFRGGVFGSPKRPTTSSQEPRPNEEQNAAPAKDPLPIPPPRRKVKYGPKHLSFSEDAYRRSQRLRDKRDALRKKLRERHERRAGQAHDELSRLRREAETLMNPLHMNDEDRIFLEQLGNLELDHNMEHELEEWRERMARAAQETEQRCKEHEARDAEAAKLWGLKLDEEALEEQRRKVEEFIRQENEKWDAHHRRLEEDAMRADAERQRAHEAAERKIREEQERFFRKQLAREAEQEERRSREKRERQQREEMARLLQERERRLREERERQQREEMARLLQEHERRLQEERERKQREETARLLRQERQLLEEIERQQREGRVRRLQEQERLLREEVERLCRAREHQERQEQEGRKLREEVERLRREVHERHLREERERLAREEQERQARLRAEEARRAAEEEQIHQHFLVYEGKWNELRTNNVLPPIDVREMPWPVFGAVSSVDQITHQDVWTFLFHPQRPGVEGKSARDKVKAEVLRFHPDKFNTRIVPKIEPSHQALAREIAGAVARILTTIMTEEVEQQK